MSFCPKCGIPVNADICFCPGCGTRLSSSVQPPRAASQSVPDHAPQADPAAYAAPAKAAHKLSGLAKAFIIMGVIAVVAAVVVVLVMDPWNFFKSDEDLIRERIQAYEDACNAGDYEGMLECMSSDARAMTDGYMGILDGIFSESTGLGFGMTDLFGISGSMGDFYDIEIKDIKIDGDHAIVTVVMSADMYGMSSSTQEAELPMVKEDSDWFIGGIDNMVEDSLSSLYQTAY